MTMQENPTKIFLDTLTVKTVPSLFQKRQELFKAGLVDLSGLKEIDSAGVAFLVKWAKAQPSGTLRLEHVPKKATSLIDTYKLGTLFLS